MLIDGEVIVRLCRTTQKEMSVVYLHYALDLVIMIFMLYVNGQGDAEM